MAIAPQAEGLNAGTELKLLRSLFMALPDALLLVATDGRISYANPAAARLLGYALDELQGLSVDRLVPQALRDRHAEHRRAYGMSPQPRPMGLQTDLQARRKDGSEVVVEIALSPLLDQGQPFVVAAIRDVGAYPRVQQALRRARYSELLARVGRLAVDARDIKSLLDQVPTMAADALQADTAMVYLADADGDEFRLVSGVGLLSGDSLGMRVAGGAQSLPGQVLQSDRALIIPDPEDSAKRPLPAHCRAAGMQAMLAVPLTDRGRPIGALVVCSRRAQHFGTDELRFVESLSNLLASNLQRAQSEEALKHAQRLESVGQLTGGIAHDFNNLLTVIQGNLQVLEEMPSLSSDAHAQQLVAAAARASRRGAELTGKLLAFSRRQVLQPSALNAGQLLHSLTDMLRRTLDQRISIELQVEPDCPPVLADPGQLESALLNIAINARDAMREGGSLRFSAAACASLPAEVRNNLDDPSASDDGFVAIAVTDTGTGMSELVKQRAFEPFFTTKEAGRGTGLGLSTVYGFVRQSRGAVALDSTPDVGTTLTLYLPRPWQLPAEEDAEAPATLELKPGLRVLLVEDDAEVRDVVRRYLDDLGCRVSIASSGEQALLLLGPEADFDLLLSDIALGAGMRGTKLAALAQQRLPQLAVLLMSGFSSELLDADRDAPQDWELLRKPYRRAELAAALARLTNPQRAG